MQCLRQTAAEVSGLRRGKQKLQRNCTNCNSIEPFKTKNLTRKRGEIKMQRKCPNAGECVFVCHKIYRSELNVVCEIYQCKEIRRRRRPTNLSVTMVYAAFGHYTLSGDFSLRSL